MTSQFKSPLASFRQERFAQELAIGRSQGEAYALSGYRLSTPCLLPGPLVLRAISSLRSFTHPLFRGLFARVVGRIDVGYSERPRSGDLHHGLFRGPGIVIHRGC